MTSPTSRPPRMARAEPDHRSRHLGLTLIEIMVALAILLSLSVLVLPITSWAFRLGAIESTRDGVEAIILRSRAEARLEGRPVELGFIDGLLEARWFDPEVGSFEEGDGSDWLQAITDQEDDPDESMRIPGTWPRRRLAPGVQLIPLRDYLETRGPSDPFGVDATPPIVDPAVGTDSYRRLAILLPDGGALVGDAFVLVEPDGDATPQLLSIDPWSARPRVGDLPSEWIDEPFVEEREDTETGDRDRPDAESDLPPSPNREPEDRGNPPADPGERAEGGIP